MTNDPDQYDDQPLPLPAVEILMGEIRRLNSRIRVPDTLFSVGPGGTMSAVRVYVLTGGPDPVLIEARLVDVSDAGLALAVARDLEIDEEIVIIARCVQEDRELFRETVTVRNQRAAPTGLEDDRIRSAMHVCGIQSNDISASRLYKAVLDSIFVEHLCDSHGLAAYMPE